LAKIGKMFKDQLEGNTTVNFLRRNNAGLF